MLVLLHALLLNSVAASSALEFLRTTPDPGTTVVNTTTMIVLDFSEPIEEGASGGLHVACGVRHFSASAMSPNAWVGDRPAAHTAFGATSTWLLPIDLLGSDHPTCTVTVDAGAYVSAASGRGSPARQWSFDVAAVNARPGPPLPSALHLGWRKLALQLNSTSINATIAHLSLGYENRFFQSTTGVQSAEWLHARYTSIAAVAGRVADVRVDRFQHAWRMPSLLVTILGKSRNSSLPSVILGGHLDTINRQNWTVNVRTGRAPGANDDGSAVAVQLELFRVLMDSGFRPERPIEFHVYSGEEEGLYGSQDVAASYARAGRAVVGMLQLDQCGWVRDPSHPVIALYQDNTSPALTDFVGRLVDAYTSTPWVMSNEAGRADSDFHSWHTQGYSSTYAAEGPVDDIVFGNNKHTPHDDIGTITLPHVMEFARLSLGFVTELASPLARIPPSLVLLV